ncbi:MAG TPA: universal stress protein [Armatimonadota bacterium]|nr:universal stress protein [Armatimonadota bacterium]
MRVLIATDGSECSYEAAREFIKLTHAMRHEVTALHVVPRLTVGRDTAYLQIQEERDALAALNTVKSIFSEVAIPVATEIRQGTPADAILEIARDGNYDLIVIGHRGRGGFRELLLGSVSKAIVQKATCSVLIGK